MGRSNVQLPRRLRRKANLASSREARRRRVLPSNRWARAGLALVMAAGYAALMWYLVFPWIDRTFVNRPAL